MGRSKKHTFISSFHLPKPGTYKANLQKILPLVLPCQQSLHGGLMQAWALESDRPGCKSQLGHLPALWPQRNFLISLIHFPHLKTVMTMTNCLFALRLSWDHLYPIWKYLEYSSSSVSFEETIVKRHFLPQTLESLSWSYSFLSSRGPPCSWKEFPHVLFLMGLFH